MTRGRGRSVKALGRSLTLGEIEDLKGQQQEAEATLKHIEENPGTARSDMVDKSRLKKEVAYFSKVIDEGSPKEFRGMNKDKAVERAKQLAEEMQKNMPTRFEMDHPGRAPGAVRKHMIWMKGNEPRVQEYKELMRRLEPNDPTAMDIERLRREK